MISTNNAGKHGKNTASNPPSNGVTQEVDLLASIVLSPEAHTPQQEGPLEGLGGIGVAAGQSVVMVEHGTLQLEVLAQERQRLDLTLLLDKTRTILLQVLNVLNVPCVAGLEDVLVTINFGLLVTPLWQRSCVCPQSDPSWNVNQLEQAGKSTELLGSLARLNLELEEGVVVALAISQFLRDRSELLVGGEEGRRNIVSQEITLGANMAELDNVAVAHALGLRWINQRIAGQDLPLVVGVVVGITSDLLTLAGNTAIVITQGVLVPVAVEEDLGVLVAHGNGVEVLNANRLSGHLVVTKSLLELGSHKVVAGARPIENSKVDLEPEQVKHEGDNDQSNSASNKVLAPVDHAQRSLLAVDIQEVPQVNEDCRADGHESKETNVFGGDDTAHAEAGQEKPLPPLPAEWLVTQLVETDVAQNTECH